MLVLLMRTVVTTLLSQFQHILLTPQALHQCSPRIWQVAILPVVKCNNINTPPVMAVGVTHSIKAFSCLDIIRFWMTVWNEEIFLDKKVKETGPWLSHEHLPCHRLRVSPALYTFYIYVSVCSVQDNIYYVPCIIPSGKLSKTIDWPPQIMQVRNESEAGVNSRGTLIHMMLGVERQFILGLVFMLLKE